MGCAESTPKENDIPYPKQRPAPSLPRRRPSNPVAAARLPSRPPVSKDKIIRTNQRQSPTPLSPRPPGKDGLYTIQEVEDETDFRNSKVPSETWSIPPPPPPSSASTVRSVPTVAPTIQSIAASTTTIPPPPPVSGPPVQFVPTVAPTIPSAVPPPPPPPSSLPIRPSPAVPLPVLSVPTVATIPSAPTPTPPTPTPPTTTATTTATTTVSPTPPPVTTPTPVAPSTPSPAVAAIPSVVPPPAASIVTPPPPPTPTPPPTTPPPPPPPPSSSTLPSTSSSSARLSPTPTKPAAPARSRTVSGPVTPLISSGKNGSRKGHVIITNRLGFPKQASAAIEFLQEQMEQRRYCGLKTASDVASYVSQEVGLSSMTPSATQKIFKENQVKPIVFVAMTEQYLTTLGVTDPNDQKKILTAAATIQKNGNVELSTFLSEILVYQFQVMVSIFYEMAQDESNPELLLDAQYEQFVHGLDWYLKSYAGGKKELTTFQVMILQVEFLKKKTMMVEQGTLVNVALVAKSLVDQAMSRPDDARMYKMLGLGEAKLKETLELAGQSVVEMMKPYSMRLMGVYMKVLQKDIEAMETGQASPIRVSLKDRMKSIGDTPDAIAVVDACAQSAQQLVDGPAKELGKTLLESVWPQLPEIYVVAAGRTV